MWGLGYRYLDVKVPKKKGTGEQLLPRQYVPPGRRRLQI